MAQSIFCHLKTTHSQLHTWLFHSKDKPPCGQYWSCMWHSTSCTRVSSRAATRRCCLSYTYNTLLKNFLQLKNIRIRCEWLPPHTYTYNSILLWVAPTTHTQTIQFVCECGSNHTHTHHLQLCTINHHWGTGMCTTTKMQEESFLWAKMASSGGLCLWPVINHNAKT